VNATRFSSRSAALLIVSAAVVACSAETPEVETSSDGQVADYIEKYPYQETHRLLLDYTQGAPSALNAWVLGGTPALVQAGEDRVVRMNNDTYYKMAFIDLSQGPVVLSSDSPSRERFNSFQLMDDRNTNYRNVIFPAGSYTLYNGERPERIEGEAIEVPSELSVVIVRVEVKDKNDPVDVEAAQEVFTGIRIEGARPEAMRELDLLSGFSESITAEANRLIDSTATNTEIRRLVASPDQVPGEVSYLRLAAGTKCCWGGPLPSHSSYETIFFDAAGDEMAGSKGAYTLTTEEPPVDAFWSLTVYDTERGGYLHPNEDDRYHISGNTGVPNEDGTFTFTFKENCGDRDLNCLDVPAGRFDLAARYYLPSAEIISGEWTIPRAGLINE